MKSLKLFLLTSVIIFIGCDLDENPPFLDDTIYQDSQTIIGARDGMFQAITTYNTQERRLYVENLYGGLMQTGKGGRTTATDQVSLNALNPGYHNDAAFLWQGLYTTIGRANGAINAVELPNNNATIQDVGGSAFFVRAWSYFKLAELWGDIPLWLELPDSENTNKAKSSAVEVYTQILQDLADASLYMKGADQDVGYPKKWAANMMAAKVWMKMATTPSLRDAAGYSESACWTNAYTEAKKVYDSGQYSLLSNFEDLFNPYNGENTAESIFELQISLDAANSQMGRNFTPWRYKGTARNQHFGWFRVKRTFHDYHMSVYGTKLSGDGVPSVEIHDLRYAGTYISEYNQAYQNPNGMARVYPSAGGNNNMNATQPYHFKFTEKDRTSMTQYGQQNVIDLRYGELLLMLAEISNELGNGEEMTYLSAVLARAGVDGTNARPEWTQGKDAFRDAIMDEYKFELIGEGYDGFHARRRGYDYFLKNTILRNNDPITNGDNTLFWSTRTYVSNRDVLFVTSQDQVMQMPIPLGEINTNQLLD
jgi:hypothetical protein